jgi:hypothetical protein
MDETPVVAPARRPPEWVAHLWPLLAGAVLLALALGVRSWLYPLVTPTAALALSVTRQAAVARAEAFLAAQAIPRPPHARQAVTFSVEGDTLAYLQQTLGMRRANRILQSEGFVFAWEVRWFRPGQEEELTVWVDPGGRILGVERILPDEVASPAAPNLPGRAAAFLRQAFALTLADYRLVETEQDARLRRRDTTFTWERRGFRLGAATQRVTVTLAGGQVVAAARFLEVPEAFRHRFAREGAKGTLLADVAYRLALLFLGAGLVAVIIGLTRGDVQWRAMRWPALLVAGVTALNDLNLLPLRYALMESTTTPAAFWVEAGLALLASAAVLFVAVWVLGVAAERWYRLAFPTHAPLWWWFSPAGLGSAPGRRRVLGGYLLAAVQLAYVSGFYWVAARYFHAWSPADVRYDDLFSTAMPWAYALLIGVEAAVIEEFLFRVLAISWLTHVLRNRWLAILLPALVWGFAHANYPNQPFFIRGIELTLWGIVFGLVFVRWGPLPTLIGHAAYNAYLLGEAFLGSLLGEARLHFGTVVALILLPLGLSLWWARRGAAAQLPHNADAPLAPPPPAPAPRPEPAFPPMPPGIGRGSRWALLLAVIGLLLGVEQYDRQRHYPWANAPGWQPAPLITRADALMRAQRAVRGAGGEVTGWVRAVELVEVAPDAEAADYLAEYLTPPDVEALLARVTPPAVRWVVSWQKPLARERWTVRLRMDGALWDIAYTQPREATGARLSPEEARTRALAVLRARGLPVTHLRLVGTHTARLPQRTLHTFTWELIGVRVGQARFRLRVVVDGGLVEAVTPHIQVPGAYVFARERDTAADVLLEVLGALLVAAALGWGAILYLRALRHAILPWAVAGPIAGLVVSGALLKLGLESATLWAELPSTISPAAYLWEELNRRLIGLLLLGAGLWALVPVLVALWRQLWPEQPSPLAWWTALWQPWTAPAVWRAAVRAQGAVVGVLLGLGSLWELAAMAGRGMPCDLPLWLVGTAAPPAPPILVGIDSWWPPVTVLVIALLAGALAFWGGIGLVIWARTLISDMPWLLRLLAGGTVLALAVLPPAGVAPVLAVPLTLMSLAGGWWALQVVRHTPLSLALATISISLLGGASLLVAVPALRLGGLLCLGALLLLNLWPFLRALQSGTAGGTAARNPRFPPVGHSLGRPPGPA